MRKWWSLVAICLGTFMLLVDVTIVNVALPDMAKDLNTSFSSLKWVIDIYALALAALLLGSGAIADVIGHRRVYLGGLALFATASAVCGFAPNPGVLILARAIQGVGGAAMFATTFALLNSTFQGRDRGTAYGIWGAVSGAAAALGPIVGGLLTQHLSWRWIFFVNLPVSVLAVALTVVMISSARHAGAPTRIDLGGMAAFTVAAGAITFALIRADDTGWFSASTLTLLAVGVIAFVGFVVIERHVASPLVDLGLLRSRAFVGVLIAALALNFAAFAYLAYTSIWLQSVLGLDPVQAGLVTLPLSAAAFFVAAASGRFMDRIPPGRIIGVGMALIGAGALGQAVLSSSSRWPSLLVGLFIAGLGVGLATPTLSSTAMSAVAVHRGGMAAGTINTARQLGFAFGIAVLGSIFSARAEHILSGRGVPSASRVAQGLSGGQAQRIIGSAPAAYRERLDSALHAAAASGLNATLVVAGVVGLIAAAAVFALVRPAPSSAEEKPAWQAAASG